MQLTDVANIYEFNDDNIDIKTMRDGMQVGQSLIKYEDLLKVEEFDNEYYIYISSKQAFIVDKNGFSEGTQTDLTILLKTKMEDKYIIKLSKKQISENKKEG